MTEQVIRDERRHVARAGSHPCCPHCHKPLTATRAGVSMSVLQAKIFDVVFRSSKHGGVTAHEILRLVYRDQSEQPGINNIRNRIHRINEKLAGTPLRLHCAPGRRWLMVQEEPQTINGE